MVGAPDELTTFTHSGMMRRVSQLKALFSVSGREVMSLPQETNRVGSDILNLGRGTRVRQFWPWTISFGVEPRSPGSSTSPVQQQHLAEGGATR